MSTTPHFITHIGSRFPSGSSWSPEATNFSIFSREARAVELLLYKTADCDEPMQVIVLNIEEQRTFFSWHVSVERLPLGTHYTWRVQKPDGSWWEILDPWAKAVSDKKWNRSRAIQKACNGLRGIVSDLRRESALLTSKPKSLDGAIIYEVHVGGFTHHPSSGVQHPSTFKGLIEKIPYLKELGITHVELLPVMAFDEQDIPDGVAALGNVNYWGYSPYGFYAPHPGYCATEDPVHEFRELVQALHAADLGIILDVVFNHTSEGNEGGPTINFKALLDDIFYHRDADRHHYRDYTGCGNTINCNHPLVVHFLVHCLEYWVNQMGVDGFRFDLASVFTRGEDGAVLANPSLPWSIELSRSLVNAPIIAEAWDAAGLYQVGSFPGTRWAEWNGRYRDVMRSFVRGDRGLVNAVATCLTGSSDLYADDHRLPSSSINFITCHDGFTLWDLVSHNDKHNMANGENNRDGTNQNLSWNCGFEGETDDPYVLALRKRQARNFMALLFLSQGVPMFLAGDEFLHTQGGNNNAWCQNNEISWLNWQQTKTNKDMLRFVRELIAFRRRHPCLMRPRYLTGRLEPTRGIPDITWHGYHLYEPLWHDNQAQVLAFTLAGCSREEEDLHVIINMSEQAIDAQLPVIDRRHWYLAFDTAALPPHDIIERNNQKLIIGETQSIHARSIVVYEARENIALLV
jgi:glycogen operon protein